MTQELNGKQIINKHPSGKEFGHLLEGFDKLPVFVDSKGKILSMPPIINSNETGKITEETKSVFIECSGFDYELLNKALNIIVTSLADNGGKIYSMTLEYPKRKVTPDLSYEKMKISLQNVNNTLGLNLKEKNVEILLSKMGYEYSKGNVKIPPWRIDILNEVDIIEDIAIAYGYDKLSPEVPNINTIAEENSESKIKSKMAEILLGLGLLELSSYHLVKKEELNGQNGQEKIEIENSKTDFKYLRPNLLIPCLRMFSENKDNEYPQKVFEIGTIFKKDNSGKSESGINEESHLLIASSPENFTGIKQMLDYFLRVISIDYKIKESNNEYCIEGRTGSIIINNKEIGFVGEAHPQTLQKWNIKMPLSILEINLTEIINALNNLK